jgi:hypothetical protein
VTGVQHWVEWIASTKGREMTGTGGRRRGDDYYEQEFASIQNRGRGGEWEWEKGTKGIWTAKGNRLDLNMDMDMDKGDRVNVETRVLEAPREIRELLSEKGGVRENEEEKKGRESSEDGISVEREFTFTSAVGRFSTTVHRQGRRASL